MNIHSDGAPILVLGGYGRVGREVTRYLLTATNASIILTSRQSRALPDWIDAPYLERVQAQLLDVADEKALLAQCAQANLVISCAGPSGQIGDKVALACKQVGVPLVDAGGYDPLLHSLQQREAAHPSSVALVINVGLLPGLSGMFPQWLIANASRAIEELDICYVGRDAWSHSSAWDIISSLGGFGTDRGFCYLRKQEVIKVPIRRAMRKTAFPAPIGVVSTMLIYAEEIARLVHQHGIGTARVYGANIGPRAALVCMLAKLLGLYKTPQRIDRAARWLVKASAADLRKLSPAYGIRVDLRHGDGTADSAMLTLTDTYRATGTIIGITARLMLEGHGYGSGVFMLHEAVDPERFMRYLQESKLIQLQHEPSTHRVTATQGTTA